MVEEKEINQGIGLPIESLRSGFIKHELPSLKKSKLDTEMLIAILSNWSHSFGNAAGVVVGNAGLLGEEMAASLTENANAAETMDNLKGGAEKMKGFIKRIRTALDAVEPKFYTNKPVNFETLWETTQERLADKENLKRVKVQIADPTTILQVDDEMLGQAIAELITNGCQAIAEKEGGLVKVSFGIEGIKEGGKMAVISVTDNGKGMSENLAKVLSKPFHLHKGAEGIIEQCFLNGLGLGLGITWLITVNHQGEMTLKTAENVGTQVTLRIPIGENVGQQSQQ